MTNPTRVLVIVVVALASACSSATSTFSIANCDAGDENSMSGTLLDEAWQISTEAQPDITMLAIDIGGVDMGAVEASESFWYFAASESVAVVTGGLPSRTTQAFGVLEDGSEVVFCPFGSGDLVAAGGAIPLTSRLVDVEQRSGDSVVAIGHVSEAGRVAGTDSFGFGVTAPGGATQLHGVVRGPGTELTFEDPPSETTAP
jgi:hypothetical protein